MKKRCSALLSACLLLGALLCGCGSSGETASVDTAYTMAESASSSALVYSADGESAWDAAEAAAAQPAREQDAEAKIVYTADLNMETTDFDEAAAALAALTEECGGYYESSTVSEWGGYPSGSYTIRVPVEQYRTFLDQAGKLCHVLSVSESAEDVSETYYDAAGRLETQQTKLERLRELLTQAENMEDIIAIESAISETEEMIDSLSGQLRHYDALVDYSTVNVYIDEVYKLSNVEEPPAGFASRIVSALGSGWRGFVNGLESAAVWLARSWPWLIVLAAIAVSAAVCRKRRKAKRAKNGRE